MIPRRFEPIVRVVAAALVSVGPPVALTIVLNPTGPLWIVFGMASIVTLLHIVREFFPALPGWITATVTYAVLALAGIMLAVNIVIVPFSAYLTWFDLVSEGTVRGAVSFVFVMTAGFFSVAFSVAVYRRAYGVAFLGVSSIVSLLALLIVGHWSIGVTTVVLLVSFVFVLVGRSLEPRSRLRAARTLLLVLAVVLGVSALMAAAHQPRGSYLVDSRLAPMLREFVVRSVPGFPVMYATPGYGYRFEQSTFGESPTLSSNSLFSVHADPGDRVYLRAEVARTFDGRTWAMEDPTAIDSTLALPTFPTSSYRAPIPFEFDDMGYAEAFGGADAPSLSGSVHVSLLGDFFAMLPHTLEMESATLYTNRNPRIVGEEQTGYRIDPPIVHRDTIVIDRRLRAGASDSIERPEGLSEYVRLYRTVPESVRRLASALRRETQFETALSIRDYLAAESEYTLEVDRIPPDADFVEHFLFDSRQGYCVQYATSFAILARLNGIPTRYVTGYLVNMPYESNYTTVSGLAAHAWPEIWLPEYGWNIVEATPPMQSAADLSWFYRDSYGVGADAYTRRQLEAVVGREQAVEASEQPGRMAFWSFVAAARPGVFVVLGIVGAAIVASTAVRRRWLTATPESRFASAGNRLVKAAARSGVSLPSRIGWSAWSSRVREACGRNRGSPSEGAHSRALNLVWTAYFGGRRIRLVDVRFLTAYHARVARALRSRSSG